MNYIIGPDEPILVTGAAGFIGTRLVKSLLDRGFRNIRCFTRTRDGAATLGAQSVLADEKMRLQTITGNLLSRNDCISATHGVAVIFHLAAGRGEKLYPDAFMNSVVTTRNLLDAARQYGKVKRFVNVSSFAVYSNRDKPRGRLLDESCPVEKNPALRGEAYCFAKVKQDELVQEYGDRFGVPYVIVRPGAVFGPGRQSITGRVGIDTFGVFLHLGGSNKIPFTYVDNCADAIARAGLTKGIDGEVFNVVDDDLPSSRKFLRLYKRNVSPFHSVYVPHILSYALCYLWQQYSRWSQGQLPPAFNLRRWHVDWKKTRYSNEKLRTRLDWTPKVSMADALECYFKSCRSKTLNA